MAGGVCPVSGEPLLGGQTISRTAVARVGTAVSDLPELLDDLDYVAGGLSHGDSAVGGGVPSSKEPVNLSLVLEVWEAVDLLAEWANALLVFVMGPKYRLPVGKDPRAIRQVFQLHADRARTWGEAPQMVEAVLWAVGRLERLASPVSKRLAFAGRCPSCACEVMAKEDQAEAACVGCGQMVDVAQARAQMLEVAASRPLPRARAIEVAELVCRRPIPDATVRSWCKRGKLAPVGDSVRRLYRAGDIVALVEKSEHK